MQIFIVNVSVCTYTEHGIHTTVLPPSLYKTATEADEMTTGAYTGEKYYEYKSADGTLYAYQLREMGKTFFL